MIWRTLSELFLIVVAAYVSWGTFFAIPFLLRGAARIDAHAARATWGFHFLILPGSVLLWPLLAKKWKERKS